MDELERVLIVDDEAMVGQVVRRCLGPQYDAEVYQEPEMALQALRERDFWLTFLDIKLLGHDGFDVLARMRDIRPATVVVLMSGYLDPDIKMRAEHEAFAFLQKPFLLSEIKSILARRQAKS